MLKLFFVLCFIYFHTHCLTYLLADIPDMINRDFYAYTSDKLPQTEFETRFESFQGQNKNVICRYVSSDFMRASTNEMETLEAIFAKEEETNVAFSSMTLGDKNMDCEPITFNAIVDLCGIFKVRKEEEEEKSFVNLSLNKIVFIFVLCSRWCVEYFTNEFDAASLLSIAIVDSRRLLLYSQALWT